MMVQFGGFQSRNKRASLLSFVGEGPVRSLVRWRTPGDCCSRAFPTTVARARKGTGPSPTNDAAPHAGSAPRFPGSASTRHRNHPCRNSANIQERPSRTAQPETRCNQ